VEDGKVKNRVNVQNICTFVAFGHFGKQYWESYEFLEFKKKKIKYG